MSMAASVSPTATGIHRGKSQPRNLPASHARGWFTSAAASLPTSALTSPRNVSSSKSMRCSSVRQYGQAGHPAFQIVIVLHHHIPGHRPVRSSGRSWYHLHRSGSGFLVKLGKLFLRGARGRRSATESAAIKRSTSPIGFPDCFVIASGKRRKPHTCAPAPPAAHGAPAASARAVMTRLHGRGAPSSHRHTGMPNRPWPIVRPTISLRRANMPVMADIAKKSQGTVGRSSLATASRAGSWGRVMAVHPDRAHRAIPRKDATNCSRW